MATRPLPEQDKRDWLRLIRSAHLGPITFHHILRYYGSAAEAIARLPEMNARAGGKRRIELASEKTVVAELKALKACGARLLAWGEPGYPTGLMQLEDAPPLLAVKGDALAVTALPGIAMVGARNASAIGQRFTRDMAAALVQHGFVVVSGLARGIDKAAHEGALSSTNGRTAAFIGTGIDVAFPPENAKLQDEIAERGAVFAEMPAGTPPLAQNFPRRNRLISGASMGVLVVEAALKSGSLITARMAAEQGREVMAVPGSPLDPRCRGSNGLIRDGAALIETVEDILNIFAPQSAPRRVEPPAPQPAPVGDDDLSRAHAEVERLLSPTPVLVDDLVRLSGIASGLVQMVLTEKELAGRVLRHPGGKVSAA